MSTYFFRNVCKKRWLGRGVPRGVPWGVPWGFQGVPGGSVLFLPFTNSMFEGGSVATTFPF